MDVMSLRENRSWPMRQMEMEYDPDFAQHGQMHRLSEECYCQTEILRLDRALQENGIIRRVLDVGHAAGRMGLTVIGDAPECTRVVFFRYHPPLCRILWIGLGLSMGSGWCGTIASPILSVRDTT